MTYSKRPGSRWRPGWNWTENPLSLADTLINRDSAPGRPPLIKQCGSDLCDLLVGGLAPQDALPLPLSVFYRQLAQCSRSGGPEAEDDTVTDGR